MKLGERTMLGKRLTKVATTPTGGIYTVPVVVAILPSRTAFFLINDVANRAEGNKNSRSSIARRLDQERALEASSLYAGCVWTDTALPSIRSRTSYECHAPDQVAGGCDRVGKCVRQCTGNGVADGHSRPNLSHRGHMGAVHTKKRLGAQTRACGCRRVVEIYFSYAGK